MMGNETTAASRSPIMVSGKNLHAQPAPREQPEMKQKHRECRQRPQHVESRIAGGRRDRHVVDLMPAPPAWQAQTPGNSAIAHGPNRGHTADRAIARSSASTHEAAVL